MGNLLVELGVGGLLGVVDQQLVGNGHNCGQTESHSQVALDGGVVEATEHRAGAAGRCWCVGHVVSAKKNKEMVFIGHQLRKVLKEGVGRPRQECHKVKTLFRLKKAVKNLAKLHLFLPKLKYQSVFKDYSVMYSHCRKIVNCQGWNFNHNRYARD